MAQMSTMWQVKAKDALVGLQQGCVDLQRCSRGGSAMSATQAVPHLIAKDKQALPIRLPGACWS